MELFRSNKREKPDIEFITKAELKKLEILPKKKRTGDLFIPRLVAEEPMMRTRWLLSIPTERGIEEYWCSFARPTMRQEMNEIPYVSTSNWNAGRMRWDDLYLEIRDYIEREDGSGRGLTEWFQGITGRSGYGGFKKTVTVEMLDPTGIAIEKWTLIGCMPTEIRYHQDMDDIDPVLGVNFSIDRAILNT